MKVAIVIPIYKEALTHNEAQALRQCIRILKGYPFILVAPKVLDLRYYRAILGENATAAFFDPVYFKSTLGYSTLLVSPFFYRQFSAFTYILIYQLDAWVFTDDLLTWAKKGYDYIGAPWLDAPPISNGSKPIINLSKQLKNRVGNGGLSLRKVKSHLFWSYWIRLVFYFIPKNEDILWSLFAPFKKPSAIEALHFAFELNPRQSFAITKRLPFGCHAWEKYDPDFWKTYIK